jgi:hypothetical protein
VHAEIRWRIATPKPTDADHRAALEFIQSLGMKDAVVRYLHDPAAHVAPALSINSGADLAKADKGHPIVTWTCRGRDVTEDDRREAAEHARSLGHERAAVVFYPASTEVAR